MIEILMQLEKNGSLKKLVNAGLMSINVLFYYEIFIEHDKMKRTTKKTSTQITILLQEKFKVSESTVHRALRTLK